MEKRETSSLLPHCYVESYFLLCVNLEGLSYKARREALAEAEELMNLVYQEIVCKICRQRKHVIPSIFPLCHRHTHGHISLPLHFTSLTK